MDDYDQIKKSALKFKGEKKKKKHKVRSKDKGKNNEAGGSGCHDERSEDAEDHGGWWMVDKYEHIQDEVALEFLPGCYAKSLSNATIVLGNPHPPGEGPDEEEIFTAVCASTNQIALKSGFGRYLSVDTRKRLMGLSEAIGEQETFLPVFEDGKLALCSYNDCFLSPDEDTEPPQIVAKSTKVGPAEIVRIRINNDPRKFQDRISDKDDQSKVSGTIYETELGYLKKYQTQGQRQSDIKEDKKLLTKARIEGKLHETLLDKRVKQKSDKYCK